MSADGDPADAAIETVIAARPRDIGGMAVRRSIPTAVRRTLGPFLFFDHMGPLALPPGQGADTPPHPHIGLATITYLFDGELVHRDSLGSEQAIRPGDVNWMTAGRGIAHSERSPDAARAAGARLHGIQTWVALPRDREEAAPAFAHHPAAALPLHHVPGVALRVIAGTAYGQHSPAPVELPTLYVHAEISAGGGAFTVDDTHAERAVYVADGEVEVAGATHAPGSLVVLRAGAEVRVAAAGAAHVMLVGGAPLDGPRHIWWNFVASSQDRIERAKAAWRDGAFAKVFHDEVEFVPLPGPR